MPFGNARLPVSLAFQACLLDQAGRVISLWILEDRACALLRRLRSLATLLELLDLRAQLLRIGPVQPHAQPRDNLPRLDQFARRYHRLPVVVEEDTPLRAKTAVPVAQVQLVVRITPHAGTLPRAWPRVHYVYPLQHLAQIAEMRARVRDDAAPQRARNARSKFQSSPTQRRQLVEQARPAYSRPRYQQRTVIAPLLDGVVV